MNIIKAKYLLALVLYGATLPLYGEIKITIEVPHRSEYKRPEMIEYHVRVTNEDARKARVDLKIEWPVAEFEALVFKYRVGAIQRTGKGLRWHGFTLKPGGTESLVVKSIAPHSFNDVFKLLVRKNGSRKKVEGNLFFPQFEGQACDNEGFESCEACIAEKLNISKHASFFVEIWDDHSSKDALDIQLLREPSLGEVIINKGTLKYRHYGEPIITQETLVDTFEYSITKAGSPELFYIENIEIYINNSEIEFIFWC